MFLFIFQYSATLVLHSGSWELHRKVGHFWAYTYLELFNIRVTLKIHLSLKIELNHAIIFYFNFRSRLTQQLCMGEFYSIFGDEGPSMTSLIDGIVNFILVVVNFVKVVQNQ